MFDWMTQFDRFSLSPDNVPAAEKTQSELHKLFYSNADTLVFKWRHYLKIYEDHLSRFRNTPFHMLEIGVAQGGSPIHRHLTADIAGAGHSLKSPSKSSTTFTPIFMISRNPCLARIAPSTVSAFQQHGRY
jgi:hypothetical protein